MKPLNFLGLALYLALAAITLLVVEGCGSTRGAHAEAPAAAAAAAAAKGIPAGCLDEATIGSAVGFPVHVETSTIKQSATAVNCTFLADDQSGRPGANVSVLVAQASYAQQALDGLAGEAKQQGVGTAPVPLGEHGLAYESPQRTAAATVAGGRLIAVTIDGMGLSSPGIGKQAAIGLLRDISKRAGE